MNVCPAYLQHPSIPSVEEVLLLKNHHYSACLMDIEETLLSNQFIHQLLTAGPHLDRYWIDSIPKKLKVKPLYTSGCRPCGWGVHIVEGPNWLVLSFLAPTFICCIERHSSCSIFGTDEGRVIEICGWCIRGYCPHFGCNAAVPQGSAGLGEQRNVTLQH
jgi:hypothetical protein